MVPRNDDIIKQGNHKRRILLMVMEKNFLHHQTSMIKDYKILWKRKTYVKTSTTTRRSKVCDPISYLSEKLVPKTIPSFYDSLHRRFQSLRIWISFIIFWFFFLNNINPSRVWLSTLVFSSSFGHYFLLFISRMYFLFLVAFISKREL